MNIKISYQTLLLPPPFAFGYTLDLKLSEKEVQVNFEMEYLNRDTISEEEILEEGFSNDDDFTWKGTLGKAWVSRMNELNSIELEDTSSHEHIWMHFRIKNGDIEKSGLAMDVDNWDFKIQELIQAIYEKAKRELPLNVKLIHKSDSGSEEYLVKGQFETLQSTINNKSITWSKMQELMEQVFSQDYEPEPSEKLTKKGLWVDMDGTGEYYFIEKSKNILAILKEIQ